MSLRNLLAVYAISILLLINPVPAQSYERDTHYFLRFALSLGTCFNWKESHIIASADWGMDENQTTRAEKNPLKTNNKIQWHAFGHLDSRYRELWIRSVAEPNLDMRLVKLGQFMHFLEDWESHAGYGIRLGHARDTYLGRDPDSLGRSPQKNHRMIQSALDHLFATCEDLGRLNQDRDRQLITTMNTLREDGLMQNLFESSNPNWKRGRAGMLRPIGRTTININKEYIENSIVRHFKPNPQKGIPDDFAPGEATGIPPSLRIPFTADGKVANALDPDHPLVELAANDNFSDIVLSLEDAQTIYRSSGDDIQSGWQLEIITSNTGSRASSNGILEILVIDSDDEQVVVQLSQSFPALEPGQSRTLMITVPFDRRPESDAIIAASIQIDDLTGTNNEDWLMLGDAETRLPELPDMSDLDPAPEGPETIAFLGSPKFFIIGSSACVMISAVTSGGDSTEKLEPVVFELVGIHSDGITMNQAGTGRWSAFSTSAGLVAGKTFQCYQPNENTYKLLARQPAERVKLSVTATISQSEAHTAVFPIDTVFYSELMGLAKDYSAL